MISRDYGIQINYQADWNTAKNVMGTVVVFLLPLEDGSDQFIVNEFYCSERASHKLGLAVDEDTMIELMN
ncbi:MAG TPA: hypothetical protein DDW65_01605 [Firmicutes bacterium]|jgi:hypothetical protein|nr:hypothetical protein [Bacillota bacterium]